MPLICQSFVENAWKKDLCANCFKSLEDHSKKDAFCETKSEIILHRSLSGQDSLTELEKVVEIENELTFLLYQFELLNRVEFEFQLTACDWSVVTFLNLSLVYFNHFNW